MTEVKIERETMDYIVHLWNTLPDETIKKIMGLDD